jgi:DNA-binding IclR family transcriptional regulator
VDTPEGELSPEQQERTVTATKSSPPKLGPDDLEVEGRSSQTVAAVERAADVLLHFTQVDSPTLGVTDISTALGLSKAAVHRLLASLRSRGLIAFDDEARRYSLGPMALVLGLTCLDRLDVRQVAAAEMRTLSAQTRETVTLSVRAGDTRVYVDQVTPNREIIMSVSIGVPFPLHAGASSKAFLAFLPPAEVDTYLSHKLSKLTPATVTDTRRLRKDLQEIRTRGWAKSFEERQSGAASVAAPVFDHSGIPAAVVSVCGPVGRFEEELDRCVASLMDATSRMSAQLGFRSRRP